MDAPPKGMPSDTEGTPSSASPDVICAEFLKVLSRLEVEQPMICQNSCLCPHFFFFQHYLLPLWDWGVTKIVCLNLGSFRHVQPNGGPFPIPLSPPFTPTSPNPNPNPNPTPHNPPPRTRTRTRGLTTAHALARYTYRSVLRNQHELDYGTKPHADDGSPEANHLQNLRDQHAREAGLLRPRARFNARPLDMLDPLQTMLRHVSALEVASMLKLCGCRRGVEHGLVREYFRKGGLVRDWVLAGMTSPSSSPLSGGAMGPKDKSLARGENNVGGEGKGLGIVEEKRASIEKKLKKLPATAGYGGDGDMVDIPVYFWDGESYTEEDREALRRLPEFLKLGHLPLVEVVDGGLEDVWKVVDEKTLVYTVGVGSGAERMEEMLARGVKPVALVWGDVNRHGFDDDDRARLDGYLGFGLDNRNAPHTIGHSHIYIRKDAIEETAKRQILPPCPVNFPSDYAHIPRREDWYLYEAPKLGTAKGQLFGDKKNKSVEKGEDE